MGVMQYMFREQKSDATAKNNLFSIQKLFFFPYIFKSFLHLWLTVAFPLESRRLAFPFVHILCHICVCLGVRAVACVRTEDNAFC